MLPSTVPDHRPFPFPMRIGGGLFHGSGNCPYTYLASLQPSRRPCMPFVFPVMSEGQ
jgi:hypothetical protein